MFEQPYIWLLALGFAFKAAGLIMRDELALRVLLAAGMAFDAIYFFALGQSAPAAFAGALMLLLGVGLIVVVLLERSQLFFSKSERAALANFRTLSPAEFRKINRLARWTIAPEDTDLLTEGKAADKLYFIEAKTFSIGREGKIYSGQGPAFVGEIMLLQGGVASATVRVQKGDIYAQWDTNALQEVMHRSRALENALVARFGHDLADKLRKSVPLEGEATA